MERHDRALDSRPATAIWSGTFIRRSLLVCLGVSHRVSSRRDGCVEFSELTEHKVDAVEDICYRDREHYCSVGRVDEIAVVWCGSLRRRSSAEAMMIVDRTSAT
jgi:hypothetical protein